MKNFPAIVKNRYSAISKTFCNLSTMMRVFFLTALIRVIRKIIISN